MENQIAPLSSTCPKIHYKYVVLSFNFFGSMYLKMERHVVVTLKSSILLWKGLLDQVKLDFLRSLIASNFSGWRLTTASTATSSVCSDPSVKFPSWVFNKKLIVTLALQNWCSQTRPILLANSRLFFNWSIQHHDLLNNYWFFNNPFLEMHEWTLSKQSFIHFLTLSCD